MWIKNPAKADTAIDRKNLSLNVCCWPEFPGRAQIQLAGMGSKAVIAITGEILTVYDPNRTLGIPFPRQKLIR